MSNNIFYDPYNEIRCDRFALEKLVKESEAKDQRIAELEEQLKNVRKETAKKVIDRVEELSVFDFKACEALYTITEPELDCILRELQGEKE